MKRLLLFMLVIFAFVACTQDVMNEQNAVNIAISDTITVGFEGSDTRIQLNEAMKTVWNKGDQVSVFYKSFDNLKYEFQGNTGDRDGVLKKVDGTWGGQTMHQTTIVYPYNTNYLVSTNGNIETILPSIQHYAEGSYGIGDNLMVAQSEFNNFSLRNTCGWLRLHLTGDGQKVKSIKFRGNNDEQVAGLVYVNTANAELTLANSVCDVPFDDESGELTPGGVDGNFFIEDVISKDVTLDLGDGVELNDESKAFYIALPPQTFEQGFTVIITRIDGVKMIKSTSKAVTIDRNHIQPMEAFNFGITDMPEISEITLRADKSIVMAGETITFFVEYLDEDGINYDITDNATIFDKTHDYVEVSNPFTPEADGEYEFYAVVGSIITNTIKVSVVPTIPELPKDSEPANTSFNHRILLVDHTGNTCGFSPKMMKALKTVSETGDYHSKYYEAMAHTFSSGDPAFSGAASMVSNHHGVSSYPTLTYNFYHTTQSSYNDAHIMGQIDALWKAEGADAGIAAAAALATSSVIVNTEVKAAVANDYRITAWLLEDGIYAKQTNATEEWMNTHDNAIRQRVSSDDISGVSLGTIAAGETASTALTLNIVGNKWNRDNLKVMVIVSAKNAKGQFEVANVAICPMNDVVTYDYK